MNIGDKVYRYSDGWISDPGVGDPRLERFKIIKLTPCGYWIDMGYGAKPKFINAKARRRFAYPTTEEAMESYRIRKRMQVWHCERALKRAIIFYEKVKLPEDENCDEYM